MPFDLASVRWRRGLIPNVGQCAENVDVSSGNTDGQKHRRSYRVDKGASTEACRISFKEEQLLDRTKLWRSVQTIMRREKSQDDVLVQPDHTADSFLQYFDSKVRSVLSSTVGHPVAEVKVTTTASLPAFRACTTDDLR